MIGWSTEMCVLVNFEYIMKLRQSLIVESQGGTETESVREIERDWIRMIERRLNEQEKRAI